MNQLHPGYKWSVRLGGFFVSISLLLFFGFALFIFLNGILILGLFLLLLLLIVEVYSRWSYKYWFYEFDDTGFKSEMGIIWKRYVSIPYERIQNVDITRGILARILGFSSINIQTAGASFVAGGRRVMSEGYLPAVDISLAEEIREYLMKKISGKKVKLPKALK